MATVEDVCWKAAIHTFNTELTKDKKKILLEKWNGLTVTQPFQGLKELIDFNRQAHDQCYDSRRGIFKGVGEALQAVHSFAPVLDVMIQQQPFVVALVWGTIRFVIQVIAAESKAGPEIAQGLKQIITALPRYQHELRLYSASTRVVQATSAVFAQVICYLVNAKAFLLKRDFRRAAKAATSNKLSRCLAELEKRDRALGREIRAAYGQGQAELKQDHGALAASATSEFLGQGLFRADQQGSASRTEARLASIDQNVKALPQMIFGASAFEDAQRRGKSIQTYVSNVVVNGLLAYNNAREFENISAWLEEGLTKSEVAPDPEPGTCKWFYRSAEYTKWVQSGYQSCLWVQGNAGCGKSVLASYLAESASTDVVLKHSFHCSRRRTLAATTHFSVTLLAELLYRSEEIDHFPSLIQKASPLARQFSSGLECPVDRLLAVLDCALTLVPSVTLIVDALDECTDLEDRDRLLGYLVDLGSKSNTRIVLLSRIGKFSRNVLAKTIQLRMDASIVEPDIALFVERKIERNQASNPGLSNLKASIATKVSLNCQGMFLLAKFIMDDLQTAGTVREIKARLEEPPLALSDYYQQNLEETGVRLRDRDKATRRSIYLLLVGAFEPLTAEDISRTLALNTRTHSINEDELFSNPAGEVLRLCAPLVTVVRDQVQFVHTSVKDFLLESVVTREDSDAFLARKSLSKLSESQYRLSSYAARLLRMNLLAGGVVEVDLESTLKKSILYRYACLYWQDHVTALPDPSDELLIMLSRFLVGNEFVTWSESLFEIKSKSGIGSQIQVKSILLEWYGRLPNKSKEKVPVGKFFVAAHESLCTKFMEKAEDKILPYLPLVRLGQYFNVGGKTSADFPKAYEYKMTVAAGFEAALGYRNPLTLRAKTQVFKEFFFQKRFDEAETGFEEIASIQREVLSEDLPDIFVTLQLLGLAQICVTKFQQAISTLTEAASGFRRLSGDEDFFTLQTEMFRGNALEHGTSLQEAYRVYENTLKLWVPIGGSRHPFSLMLKTAFGSVCRKLDLFDQSEEALLDSLTARKRLFTTENVTYLDSVLQVAALNYESGRGKEGLEYLELVRNSDALKVEFERDCQEQHIRALIDLEAGFYTKPRAILQRLLNEASGEGRNNNNRELLWVLQGGPITDTASLSGLKHL